jgi:myo-inositol-1(or 4)-monophosphatase
VEEKLKVTTTCEPKDALINTGFPYNVAARPGEILGPLGRMLPAVRAVRNAGAASLDLAYVAAGRADGYWEYGLYAWDVAAGLLLVTEAGGVVSDITGAPYVLEKSDSILAVNRSLQKPIMDILS